MTGELSANMARGQSTYRSGPQGAAVKSPSAAVSASLSTTHTVRAGAPAPAKRGASSGKSAKRK
jgi:hypothetical protein